VVFTSGIVDDVAPTGVCVFSVLLTLSVSFWGAGVGVEPGGAERGEGLDTLLSFEGSGRPGRVCWSLVTSLGLLWESACGVGGFWSVGWLFVNWIVDASIFTTDPDTMGWS
jgi:hypothetical protein